HVTLRRFWSDACVSVSSLRYEASGQATDVVDWTFPGNEPDFLRTEIYRLVPYRLARHLDRRLGIHHQRSGNGICVFQRLPGFQTPRQEPSVRPRENRVFLGGI